MRALWQGRGKAVEEGLHGHRADLGDDQREGLVAAGADGGVEPGGGVTVVDDAFGAEATLVPDPDAAALLAHTGLVLAPELDLGVGVTLGHLVQRGGKTPLLNRSCAALSALGWRGRIFCQDRSSVLISRRMPPSR